MVFSSADNSESFRLTHHWFRDFAPTYSLMTDQITNLSVKNIMQVSICSFPHPHLPSHQHLCDMVESISSLALGHGGTQLPLGGNEWHLLCFKPCFLHMGYLGGLWGHEGMVVCSQSCFKLLLCPAQPFQDDSVSLEWLEINCKMRKFSFWQPLFLILFVQCHRQGRKEKGRERRSRILQLFI